MKVGDKVVYKIGGGGDSNCVKGATYEVIDIMVLLYPDKYYRLAYKDNELNILCDAIYDYVYTNQELRKLKLDQISSTL